MRTVRKSGSPVFVAPAAQGVAEGKVLGVEGAAIVGWAWDPSRPYDAVMVEIYCGGTKLGQAKADLFDLELAKANLGNGMHRFELRLHRLPPGAPPFQIRTVVADTEVELHPSILLPTLVDAERLLSGSEYLGRVTGIENGAMCGWVVNRRNPHEPPVLTLRDGSGTLLTEAAREPLSVDIEPGVMANAYRFELPLPSSMLDGNLHHLSVSVGEPGRDLDGSGVLFGPADVASLSRTVITAFEKLQHLERRVESLQPVADLSHFEKTLTARILDRIDMLLSIHRDSIDQEMAVIRRRLTEIGRNVPNVQPDVIPPATDIGRIEDEVAPPPTVFRVIDRASPLLTLDLATRPAKLQPRDGLTWSKSSLLTGITITGSGSIGLDRTVGAPASLILSGEGAQDPFVFCGMMFALDGSPLAGRVDVFEDTSWNFTGTTIDAGITELKSDGLSIEFLSGFTPPKEPLTLQKIAVFGHRRAPLRVGPELAKASVVYVGAEPPGSGWYAVEANRRGTICWMGARSETMFELRPSRSYRLLIPEVRPLAAELIGKMHVAVTGVSAGLETVPMAGDRSAFSVRGQCALMAGADGSLPVEISFPKEFVRSPKALGLNNDERLLTIAIRALALSADG